MKKMLCLLITLMTLTSFIQGKSYKHLLELNNNTSRICNNVRAALFKKGDRECACDLLEDWLRIAAEEEQYEGPGGWISQFMGASDLIDIRTVMREVLADEPDDEIKWKEYNEYCALKSKLQETFKQKQDAIKKKEAEEKEKAKKRF